MAHESTFVSLNAFSTQHAHLIEVLYAEAKGLRWGLSRKAFSEKLHRSAEKRFSGAHSDAAVIEAYLESLHIEDLALACACSEGIDTAWEFFIAHFRQDLRNASRAILRSSGSSSDVQADELADSLYAELFGIRSAGGGQRKSLFEYFHGRSKLSTWLRAVLAQRHVDLLRTVRGTVSLDSGEHGQPLEILTGSSSRFRVNNRTPHPSARSADAVAADPDRAKYLAWLDAALSIAFASLTPRERMLLACYYVDQLTLAEIGRTLGEHESTVSRQLDRTRRVLRETVTEVLRQGIPSQDGCVAAPGLDEAQVELAFEYALEDWPFDLSRALSKAEAAAEPPE